jgi:two-component system chemotaxis response regulator CheY
MRVLIVDDSRSMRKILTKMMSTLGYTEVDEAEHGEIALERLASQTPQVALVDWNMPVMGGLDFIKAMRGERSYDQVKVLVVTSETSPRIVYDALKAGADEYAMKPLDAEVLGDKLRLMGLAS